MEKQSCVFGASERKTGTVEVNRARKGCSNLKSRIFE